MANNVADFINTIAGQALKDQPLLMGNAPPNQLGLYGIGMGGGTPKRQKRSALEEAADIVRQQFPQGSSSNTMHGHETGLMNAGPEEQQKKSFWQTPGGGILGTLLSTLGTAALGGGLGYLSGGRRGAGQGAAMGGGMAFLSDLAQRKAASQMPANIAKQQQEQQELAYKQQLAESQGIPTSVKEYQYGLQIPGYAQFQQQQLAAKNAMTPYQQASLGLQQQGLDIKKTTAEKGPTGRALPAKEADTLGEGMLMPDLLNTLKNSIEEHKSIMGPGMGRINRMNPYNANAQAFQADLNRVRQMVGKFMEGGVLRKEDEVKYEKILATMADTPETAYSKLEGLMGDMSKKYNAHLSSLGKSGFDVSKYEPLSFATSEQKNIKGVPQSTAPQGQFKVEDIDAAIARKLAAAGK